MKQTNEEQLRKGNKEMLNDLQSIAKIVNSAMPSSAYLRHDSDSYNEEKVRRYELCKSVLALCH